jgi:two-component system chemotaxis response regulator CheB
VKPLRVLVADDSVLFRRVLTEVLGSLPQVEVVGTASNGKVALAKIREMRPDLLTLDLEMPELDGLAVLDELRRTRDRTSVIVVSALTKHGGQITMKALDKGAFDFITKPESASAEESRESIRKELAPRLRALMHRLEIRDILKAGPVDGGAKNKAPVKASPKAEDLAAISGRMARLASPSRADMVLIGVSTGGPSALSRVIPAIPADIGVPILIVQHMPPIFTQSLAESLAARSAIAVREAADSEVLKPNTAYIAPGGRHMKIIAGFQGDRAIQITDDPPENNCRPAVDYLFRSAASNFPGRALAVILTGMGSDGTIGLKLLKRHGCYVIAQDEATSVVYGMPKAALDAGTVDVVLPLDNIAGRITSSLRGIAG